MQKLTLILTIVAGIASFCLGACTVENQTVPPASIPVAYSLSTPIGVLKNDPRAEVILYRDIPDVLVNPRYQLGPTDSLLDVENFSGSTLAAPQLARVQIDLAQLSAAERPSPSAGQAPPTLYATSFVCADGNTPVQNAVCGNPQLASLDVQMGSLLRQHLGDDDVFERDQLLAFQRAWLLGLPQACGVSAGSNSADPAIISCLAGAYQTQIAALSGWPAPPTADPDAQAAALAKYVTYMLLDAKQPALCQQIGGAAGTALADDGAIDPARLSGAQEIAGSHGPLSGANPQGGVIGVDLYRTGLFGGYQIRARGVTLPGAASPLIGPESLGNYVETLPNGGGRFVNFPSQTGDYGAIDVFSYQGQLLALVTDTVGYNSPAPPGDAAVAGVFTLSQGEAAPACLFETFLMPPPLEMGIFSQQPSLTPFLALIAQIEGPPPDALAPSDRQDISYFQGDLNWTMLNMPLLIVAQAQTANWTGWLRYRHDQVLDNLFAWSQKNQQNQAAFNQLFALLRPAATELETIYVQQQGLSAAQAEQATAIAMMELLYETASFTHPGLGSGPVAAADYAHYQPRYPILANPQS
jgi:uncharacterized protein